MFSTYPSVLIKNARLYEAGHPLCGRRLHVLVEDGIIAAVDVSLRNMPASPSCVIEGDEVGVSPGWLDLCADFCDPGFQKKEDVHSGTKAAAAGGFVGVCLLPHTEPVLQTQSAVTYIKHKADNQLVHLYPMGACSVDAKGEVLTDMLQMHEVGVSIFTNGGRAVHDTYLLLQVLRYVKIFDGLVLEIPQDPYLARTGSVHEGISSTKMGIQGVPSLAEENAVYRSLSLLDYAQSRLHLSCITSAVSLALIKKAKRKGLRVTCDVAVQHLLFDEKALLGFDAQHKVYPPYRSKRDRLALLRGVREGVVDAIVSAHTPQYTEDKEDAFLSAAYGNITLQTTFSVLCSLQHELPLAVALPKLYRGPYHVMQLKPPSIRVGEAACLTVFDTAHRWRFCASNNYSKSINSPFYEHSLQGGVLAILRDSFVFFTRQAR